MQTDFTQGTQRFSRFPVWIELSNCSWCRCSATLTFKRGLLCSNSKVFVLHSNSLLSWISCMSQILVRGGRQAFYCSPPLATKTQAEVFPLLPPQKEPFHSAALLFPGADNPHVERCWGRLGGFTAMASPRKEEEEEDEEKEGCVKPLGFLHDFAVKVNHPHPAGPWLGRHDPPSGHCTRVSPQRHMCTEYL